MSHNTQRYKTYTVTKRLRYVHLTFCDAVRFVKLYVM
jgi:hypothetical protein